ncbi:MAG: Maf family protein [Desulfonatronovibrionaceae bacterium]
MPDIDIRGPFRSVKRLVLASASPRRQTLLTSLGISFFVRPSRIKEPPPQPGQDPGDYVLKMAELKAKDTGKREKDSLVLGADTAVVLDGEIMGKPKNPDHALKMLSSLAGREHEVISGIFLTGETLQEDISFTASTWVRMDSFDTEILKAYIDTGETEDKAGAYAMQGAGGFLVDHVRGSYTNVIGLPLSRTAKQLLKTGCIEPA